jgi:aminoglycoside phosphotransferase
MNFVRRHTAIPVPTVWLTVHLGVTNWIVMTRVRGSCLHAKTWEALSKTAQDHIIAQLRSYIDQLRALPPPSSPAICSVLGGPVRDFRLCMIPHGPYANEDEMNAQARGGSERSDEEWCRMQGLPSSVSDSHSKRHHLVFTHGDVRMRNIMVQGDTVTGLIDWECAGWFPAHWEYLKANFCDTYGCDWQKRLSEFIPPYALELEADQALRQVYWSAALPPYIPAHKDLVSFSGSLNL